MPYTPSPDEDDLNAWLRMFDAVFPEFADAGDALKQSRLAMAITRTDRSVWGVTTITDDQLYATGVLYLAAHLLAMSPGGESMRLEGETTIYKQERDRMARSVASGFRSKATPGRTRRTGAIAPSRTPRNSPTPTSRSSRSCLP